MAYYVGKCRVRVLAAGHNCAAFFLTSSSRIMESILVAEALQRWEYSLTRKIQDFVLKGKEICIGLDESRKAWNVRDVAIVRHE
jgi:hypothetical protein